MLRDGEPGGEPCRRAVGDRERRRDNVERVVFSGKAVEDVQQRDIRVRRDVHACIRFRINNDIRRHDIRLVVRSDLFMVDVEFRRRDADIL